MEKVEKSKKLDYNEKFKSFRDKTLFEKLSAETQKDIRDFAFEFRLTFQEFRQIVEYSRDLEMWLEQPIKDWWNETKSVLEKKSTISKQVFLSAVHEHIHMLKGMEKNYKKLSPDRFRKRSTKKIITKETSQDFYGMCPVASAKTVCCNLRTIDAVENCTFGCSYCTIQTFYTEDVHINQNLAEKLDKIKLEPDRFYHFGTGQASDSLVYGDRDGLLAAHCQFAEKHPNILMEFKTKSKNIAYFLENKVPANVVCSWSLNPQIIIDNEEHFTASLEERLTAARQLADRGIKVAFHFHPMVYFAKWQAEYAQLAERIMGSFSTQEILFISLGSVTLIKPVIQKIRDLGNPSKILQMDFVTDPHGKFTYPDEIKIEMFRHMYAQFGDWHNKVFFYLCMEKSTIWQNSLGYVYPDNESFEREFGRQTMYKIDVTIKNSLSPH